MVKRREITAFNIFIYSLMCILVLFILIPIWSTVVLSFISENERLSRGMFILYPKKLNFSAYKLILRARSSIYSGYLVTIFRVTVGTACNMFVTAMLAYAFSKRDLPMRRALTFFVYLTMLFSGGLVPTFLVVKNTGMYNSLAAYVVPGLVSAWNLFLMRNFFMQIPAELEEAAIIDGASPPVILVKIIIPLSVPALLTISFLYAAWHWNSWFDGLLYIQNRELLTLQNILRNTLTAANIDDMYDITASSRPPLGAVRSAMIVVSTLPILCVFPFVQKYFKKGILIGSIKG